MMKYGKIINEENGLCEVGTGDNSKIYRNIGYRLLDVQQSDIDNQWYLAEKCPMKTDEQKANKVRNELIEQVNYPLKAKIAYTGVRFDYEGQELVFETNETSISMVNFTAMMAQQARLSNISNWKCRKTVEPFEPVSVTFTMAQFQQLLTFASQMVLGAFAVEEQINEQIQALTVEQLNNAEFIETFKQQMELAYSQVPVKLEGLFNEDTEN